MHIHASPYAGTHNPTKQKKVQASKHALKTNHTMSETERERERDSYAHENNGSPRRHARARTHTHTHIHTHTHTHTYTHKVTHWDLAQSLVLGEQPVEELIVCYKSSQPVTSSVSSLHRHIIQ
jgi:hypothetical protein